MSKFKAGDRVRFVAACGHELRSVGAKIGEIATVVDDGGPSEYPYNIQFQDGTREIMAGWQIRRLVKRKRAKVAAPDRVMVAAQLMAFVGLDTEQLPHEGSNDYRARIRQIALEQADALIAEGSK